MQFTIDHTTNRIPVFEEFLGGFTSYRIPVYGLEIGSLEGRTAIWLCDNILKPNGSKLITVDPWFITDNYERYLRNIIDSGQLEKIITLRTYSSAITPELVSRSIHPTRATSALLDFAYIDGDHQAWSVLSDAIQVWPCLKVGGIMIFDDYSHRNPASEAQCHIGIDAFLAAYGGKVAVLHKNHQVVIRKERP